MTRLPGQQLSTKVVMGLDLESKVLGQQSHHERESGLRARYHHVSISEVSTGLKIRTMSSLTIDPFLVFGETCNRSMLEDCLFDWP